MKKSEIREMPFIAVILGGDMNCYGVARTFYEAYGIRSVLLGRAPVFPTAGSGLFAAKLYDANLLSDDVLLKLLRDVSGMFPGKRKFIFGTSDDYVRHIIHNRAAIEKIGSGRGDENEYIIPMISEVLFDRLDDKDSFYEMCEEYGLPYPRTTVFDCSKASEVAGDCLDGFDIHFDYPIFIKPASNVEYFNMHFEGKKKGYKIGSGDELRSVMEKIIAAGYRDKFIFQEYIEGDDDSMYIYSAYSDRKGRVRMMSGGHILMHDRTPELIGNYNAIGEACDRDIAGRLAAFLEKIGFKGICHFDLQYDSKRGDYVVYEINIRQGRSNYYMTAGGMNYARLLVDDYINENAHGSIQKDYREDPGKDMNAAASAAGDLEFVMADKPFIVSNVSRSNLAGAIGRDRVNKVRREDFYWFQLAPYDRSIKNFIYMKRLERSIMNGYRKYSILS